jgi:hypothetical protein
MRSKIQNTILTTFLIVGLAACSPGGDQPAPDPDPAPQPTQPPPPPVPPPPDGTDYTKPGTHGKTGVETDDDEKPVIDVDTSDWREGSGLIGSSEAEMAYWDTTHNLKECPEDDIYVYAESRANSVARCADGAGYAGVCRSSEKKAWARAVNVVQSCERVPSCRARVTGTGQEWLCRHYREMRFTDDGTEVVIPEQWVKMCWTQYKITCFMM